STPMRLPSPTHIILRLSPSHHPTSLHLLFFFFNPPATTEIYTLSLHDALPIFRRPARRRLVRRQRPERMAGGPRPAGRQGASDRSEEHTSELQSPDHLVCRLLLEKKKKKKYICVIRHKQLKVN